MDEESIFIAALERKSQAERAGYLDKACAGDAQLRSNVDALLAAHEKAGGFLRGSSPADAATGNMPSDGEMPGKSIGPYKLLEQIGEGGFGVVYMADQQAPVRRRVALKIIKPGMDTRQVLTRFKAELLALSLMDHPNIARALDAGATDSGRPYFVMELIRGVPITDYCDQNNLAVHERLDLFTQVCHAVQHAHQKGIIHRDIKPSNVLITLNDGRPLPKVIDFGVAKAINQHLTNETLFTRFAEMIGTPLYMSPEQAEMTSLDIDTRADIYSLGVLLYELLTGSTPFDKNRMRNAAFDEIRRIIREEEPPKPSLRISTLGDTRTAVAAHRHVDSHHLGLLVRGDLDWIVMKALEKDRTHRYDTASNFAADVQRYLSDLPVEASPPSAIYRLGKFARRNRVAFTTATLVLAALLVGTVVSTTQAIRAIRSERLAQARFQEAEEAREAEAAQRQIAERQRQIAEIQKTEADKMRQQAEANFRKARQAVDEYFTLVSESKLFDVPGLQPLRKQLLEAALRYYQGFLAQRSSDPNIRVELAATYLRVAQVDMQNNRTDDSIRTLQQCLPVLETLLNEQPRLADLRHLAGFRRTGRILQFFELWPSDAPEAIRVSQQAIQIWEQFVREYPDVEGFQSDLATFYHYLGDLNAYTKHTAAALQLFQKACRTWEQLLARHPKDVEYRSSLADDLEYAALQPPLPAQEREAAFHRALTLREGLVAEFPGVPEYRAGLANGLRRFGGASEPIQRRALEMWEKLVADYPTFPGYRKRLASMYGTLAMTLQKSGRLQEAQRARQQAVDVLAKLAAESPGERGDNLIELADAYVELAHLLHETGRPNEALAVWHDQIAVLNKLASHLPNRQGPVGHGYRFLAFGLWELGRLQEAEQAYKKSLAAFEKRPAGGASPLEDRHFLADTHRLLGDVLVADHRPDQAEKAFRRAIEIHETPTGELPAEPFNEAEWAASYLDFAHFLASIGRPQEAEEMIRRLISRTQALVVAYPGKPAYRERVARTPQELALLLKNDKRPVEAQKAYVDSLKSCQDLVSDFPDTHGDYRFQLAQTEMGLAYLLRDTGHPQEAEKSFRQALAVYEKLAAAFPSADNYRMEVGHTLWQLGYEASNAGRQDEAEKDQCRALAVFEKLAADVPQNRYYGWEQGFSNWNIASLMRRNGRLSDAERSLGKAIDVYAKLAAQVPNDSGYRDRLARSHYDMASCLREAKRMDDAEKHFRQAATIWEQLAADVPGEPVYLVHAAFTETCDLGPLARSQNRDTEAEKAYRKALALTKKMPAADLAKAGLRNIVGITCDNLSEFSSTHNKQAEAEKLNAEALAVWEKLVTESPGNVDSRYHLGQTLRRRGDILAALKQPREAEQACRKSLEVFRYLAVDNPSTRNLRGEQVFSCWKLGYFFRESARLQEAVAPFQQALELSAKYSADFPKEADASASLARSYSEILEVLLPLSKHAEAAKLAVDSARVLPEKWDQSQRAVAWLERCVDLAAKDNKLSSADRPAAIEKYSRQSAVIVTDCCQRGVANPLSANELAWKLATRPEIALRSPNLAVELATQAVGLTPKNGDFWNTLGVAQFRAGNWQAAETTLRKSMQLRSGGDGIDWFFLGMASWQLGRKDEARKWCDKAIEWTEKNRPRDELLRRFRTEAEELLGTNKTAVPKLGQKEEKPKK